MALIPKQARDQLWKVRLRVRLTSLSLANRFSKRSVAGGEGPVVSLTSYGDRVDLVHLTLESIALGSMTPGRLVLWIDDRDVSEELTPSLRRLRARGLEILQSENFGPHTKYYPYVESRESFDSPLVTADDDILYPKSWLQTLYSAYLASPDQIACYRARRIKLIDSQLAPYSEWDFVADDNSSALNFATGVSGVIYPPAFLQALKGRGRAFMNICRAADDVWLHHTAFTSKILVRQISATSAKFPVVDSTQAGGLKHANVAGGLNDEQISAVYSTADVNELLSLEAVVE